MALGTLTLAAAIAPATAAAQQASSATMRVSLVVRPACSVEASPLSFAGDAGSTIDAESRIEVSCNTDVPVTVGLDRGANEAAGQARLAGSSGFVPYAIYSDAARRVAWDAQVPVAAMVGGGSLQLVAYGRVEPAATSGAAGDFTDTVTVTIEF